MARYARRPDPSGRAPSASSSSPSFHDDLRRVLTRLPQVRGTFEANVVWAGLFSHCWLGTNWPHVESLIRQVQTMSDAGQLSAGERFFLVAQFTDAAASSRATVNARFVELDQEIEDFERAHGLTEGEFWYTYEAPAGHIALNAEWDAISKAERIRWLEELGEPEIARLLRDDEDAFDARCSEGGRDLFAPIDHDS